MNSCYLAGDNTKIGFPDFVKKGHVMPPAPTPQNKSAANAQKYFRKADQAEASVNQIRRTERNAAAAKTAKLRELRMAKDEADRAAEEAVRSAGDSRPEPQARKRAATPKPAAMKRMIY